MEIITRTRLPEEEEEEGEEEGTVRNESCKSAVLNHREFPIRGFDSRPMHTVGRDHWLLGNVRTGLHDDVQPALPVGHL
jgi:hypothetical protein